MSVKFTGGFRDNSEQAMAQGIRDKLDGLRCPTHGQGPEVSFKNGELQIRGCCNRLIAAAHGRLGGKAA